MEDFRKVQPSNPNDFEAFRKNAQLERTQKDYRGKPIPAMPVRLKPGSNRVSKR